MSRRRGEAIKKRAPTAPCRMCGEVETSRGAACAECVAQKAIARGALQRAIRRGEIQKAETCQACGMRPPTPAGLHGHHHRGYSRADALNVLWLCQPCHYEAHRLNEALRGSESPANAIGGEA